MHDDKIPTRRKLLGAAVVAPAVAALGLAGPLADQGAAARRVIPAPDLPFSRVVIHGGVAYLSGSIGRDPATGELPRDFAAQCRQVLERMKAAVEAAGSTMERVLRCTCYLTDAADLPALNALFREYFPQQPPARSTVVVKALVVAGATVEIDCIAAL